MNIGDSDLNAASYVFGNLYESNIRWFVMTVVVDAIYRRTLQAFRVVSVPCFPKVIEVDEALNAASSITRLDSATLADSTEKSLKSETQRISVGVKTLRGSLCPLLFVVTLLTLQAADVRRFGLIDMRIMRARFAEISVAAHLSNRSLRFLLDHFFRLANESDLMAVQLGRAVLDATESLPLGLLQKFDTTFSVFAFSDFKSRLHRGISVLELVSNHLDGTTYKEGIHLSSGKTL